MDDDSPWHDDDVYTQQEAGAIPGGAPTRIAEQEWNNLEQRYADAGYRDGITAGKNARLQAGFDQGFELAAPYARRVGALRGIAASILSLLTVPTANATKNAGQLLQAAFPPSDESSTAKRDALVAELRDLVSALGRLDAHKVLPPDEEAEAHAREHEDEGISEVLRERREMREMEALMSGLGGDGTASKKEPSGAEAVAECERRLAAVLGVFGLESVLSPDRS
ncbi:hypothetical protein JCM10908_003831 [Rhodotorula pacifica]|uniref:Yae1p n=1 Tax=Rhodotorula pacifica TaxID=1495444 RepID=UPI00316FDAAB